MITLILLLLWPITALGHYRSQTRRGSPQLPRSAFAYAPKNAPRSQWKYPVPTKAQARRSHLSEADRYRLHRGSLRAASNPRTKLSYAAVARASRSHGSPVASLTHGHGSTRATRNRARRLAAADTRRHARGGPYRSRHQRGTTSTRRSVPRPSRRRATRSRGTRPHHPRR